jgi:hypothetical protein
VSLTRLATVLVVAAAGCGGSGGPTPVAAPHCYANMSDPEPLGALPAGTKVVTLRMRTDRDAYCRWSHTEGLLYVDVENPFDRTGGREHSTGVTGLAPGQWRLFAKCGDVVEQQTECSTPHDLIFAFSIPE